MFLDIISICLSVVALGIAAFEPLRRFWVKQKISAEIATLPKQPFIDPMGPLLDPKEAKKLGGVQCAKCHLIVQRFTRLLNGSYICANCIRGNT